jgi:hypothetical protein
MVDSTLQILIEHQQEEKLFLCNESKLVRIEFNAKTGQPTIVSVGLQELMGHVIKHVDFVRSTKRGRAPASPPDRLFATILSLPKEALQFRPLRRIVDSPVLLENGRILSHTGYDEASELYYAPKADFNIPLIPENPTGDNISMARQLIEEVFCDFPFKDESSRTNCMAALLTPFLRDLTPTVPLALINAPEKGTGKSLLAAIIGELATGTPPFQTVGFPQSEEELRKTLTSAIKAGYSIIIFDNVTHEIKSPVLCATLTNPWWSDRILGGNNTFQSEQRQTWLATGNNILLGGDLGRRVYEIRLDSEIERPWERKNFRHPNLIDWIREHRGQIVGAIFTLIRAWVVAGRPLFTEVTLGSFENWTRAVGGVLAHAGFQDFLANLIDTNERMASEESEDWRTFFDALLHYKQTEPFTAKEISGIITSEETEEANFLRSALPSSVRLSLQKNPSNLSSALGTFLQRNQGRRFKSGESQYFLNNSQTFKRGARIWFFSQG